jgi:NADH-quinone oxidoreductase subunit H
MNLQQIFLDLFYTLIFPGLLFTAVVGLLLTWVDRKVTAVVQSRIGPPWYQPFADIGKLMGKKMVVPKGGSSIGFMAAPLISIAGATLASVIVIRALINPQAGFVGDLIVLLYLTMLPALALIIGGAASRSPFGAIGASREMSMVLAYEVGFLLSIFVVIIQTKSIQLSGIIAYQAAHGAIAFSISGILALFIALMCFQAKLGFLPFDISEADTELIGGPLAEYSGSGLALFKISRAMMFLQLPVFAVLLFMGANQLTLLSMAGFLLKLLAVLVLIIVIKITHARLRLDQMLRLFWGRLAIVGLIAVVFALVGW